MGREARTDRAAAAGNQPLWWTEPKATSPYRRRSPPTTTTPRSHRPRTADSVAVRPLPRPEAAKAFLVRVRPRDSSQPWGTIFPSVLWGS